MIDTAASKQNYKYTAALLKKLIDPQGDDPSPADFARLSETMLPIALAVYGEGRDKKARRARLVAETTARELSSLMADVELCDPGIDLATIQQASSWQAFDLADVLLEELPETRWLVKPYISQPSVNVFFGKAKSLKSMLVLDMCLHVAGGIQWLVDPAKMGGGNETRKAPIVWIDLENGQAVIKRRMKAIANAIGVGKERDMMRVFSMPNPWPDMSHAENTDAMITRLKEMGEVGLVVIDHLGAILGTVDENSPLVASVMGNLRRIAEDCTVAIVIIHHAKKGQGKDSGDPADSLRGHGAILANVDGAYLVERDRADRTQLKLTPVAVRGPDVSNLGAQFSFEQDANLELSQARFWRVAWQSDHGRAMETVLSVLKSGEKNFTQLVAAVKQEMPGLSDNKVRGAIAALEGTKDIIFTQGSNNSKLYRLAD